MNARGVGTVPAIVLAALAGMATAVCLADWMVVEVRAPEPDNVHFTVPFPLVVADVAAWFIPAGVAESMQVPVELREQRELVLSALEELVRIPDATLVKVEDGPTRVVIRKEGEQLLLEVDDVDATVHCVIPVAGISEALARWDWQSFEPALLLDVLHQSATGELLSVEADGARVAVRMW